MLMSSGDNNRAQCGTSPQPTSQTSTALHGLTTIWQPACGGGGTADLATSSSGEVGMLQTCKALPLGCRAPTVNSELAVETLLGVLRVWQTSSGVDI